MEKIENWCLCSMARGWKFVWRVDRDLKRFKAIKDRWNIVGICATNASCIQLTDLLRVWQVQTVHDFDKLFERFWQSRIIFLLFRHGCFHLTPANVNTYTLISIKDVNDVQQLTCNRAPGTDGNYPAAWKFSRAQNGRAFWDCLLGSQYARSHESGGCRRWRLCPVRELCKSCSHPYVPVSTQLESCAFRIRLFHRLRASSLHWHRRVLQWHSMYPATEVLNSRIRWCDQHGNECSLRTLVSNPTLWWALHRVELFPKL